MKKDLINRIPLGINNSISIQDLAAEIRSDPQDILKQIQRARCAGMDLFFDEKALWKAEIRVYRPKTESEALEMMNREKAALLCWEESLRPAIRHYSGYDLMTVTSYFDEG